QRCVEKPRNIGIFLRLFSLLRAILLQTSMVPVMSPEPRAGFRYFLTRHRSRRNSHLLALINKA
ncbi:MAG: hypothetical protein AB7U34_08950, partial [Novosphingobium sp.]